MLADVLETGIRSSTSFRVIYLCEVNSAAIICSSGNRSSFWNFSPAVILSAENYRVVQGAGTGLALVSQSVPVGNRHAASESAMPTTLPLSPMLAYRVPPLVLVKAIMVLFMMVITSRFNFTTELLRDLVVFYNFCGGDQTLVIARNSV